MSEAEKLDIKAENRIVSDWLLYYHERLQEQKEHMYKLGYYPKAGGDSIRAQGTTSDPTANQVIKREKHDSRWFDLIADVERMLPEKQRVFLEIRREATHQRGGKPGRPAWVAYVQCKYPLVMARRTGRPVDCYCIGADRLLYEWWNRIVEYAARIAAKRGLL